MLAFDEGGNQKAEKNPLLTVVFVGFPLQRALVVQLRNGFKILT